MDNLFTIRSLTAAVNNMQAPPMTVFDRLFRPKMHGVASSLMAIDVISGSEAVLQNISIHAPADVEEKTDRKTITLQAPRISNKRNITAASLQDLRAYGEQFRLEQEKTMVAREQLDMLYKHWRTWEFWGVNCLKGKIYDSDMTTILVNYNLDATHRLVLEGDDLFSSSASNPITQLETYKEVIIDDAGAVITGWLAFCGRDAYKALLKNTAVLNLLSYHDEGRKIAKKADVEELADCELIKYGYYFKDSKGKKRRFIEDDYLLLIGLCDQLVDCPFAPVVDRKAPGGVGNVDINGKMVPLFSKMWEEEDPSGLWVKEESRVLPVLQRPGAVMWIKVL